jgi:hypothetical protein
LEKIRQILLPELDAVTSLIWSRRSVTTPFAISGHITSLIKV